MCSCVCDRRLAVDPIRACEYELGEHRRVGVHGERHAVQDPDVDVIIGDGTNNSGFSNFGCTTPQNETSIAVNPTNPSNVIAGANDYRVCCDFTGLNDATAWAYRDAKWAEVIVGVSPDPADKEKITDWARSYWQALHPYSAGGAYVNFMMEEGDERIRATYKDHYDRLAAIKKKYDPTNFFRVNQNIAPA